MLADRKWCFLCICTYTCIRTYVRYIHTCYTHTYIKKARKSLPVMGMPSCTRTDDIPPSCSWNWEVKYSSLCACRREPVFGNLENILVGIRCICLYVCTSVWVLGYGYMYSCAYVFVCVYACLCICMVLNPCQRVAHRFVIGIRHDYIYIYIYIYICIHACILVRPFFVSISVCIYTCLNRYLHTYLNTRMCRHNQVAYCFLMHIVVCNVYIHTYVHGYRHGHDAFEMADAYIKYKIVQQTVTSRKCTYHIPTHSYISHSYSLIHVAFLHTHTYHILTHMHTSHSHTLIHITFPYTHTYHIPTASWCAFTSKDSNWLLSKDSLPESLFEPKENRDELRFLNGLGLVPCDVLLVTVAPSIRVSRGGSRPSSGGAVYAVVNSASGSVTAGRNDRVSKPGVTGLVLLAGFRPMLFSKACVSVWRVLWRLWTPTKSE